jgi:S-adenosyl methyltransferase
VTPFPEDDADDQGPSGDQVDPEEKFGGKRWWRPNRRRDEPARKVRHASQPTAQGDLEPAEIDITVAHASRVYDYLLGGKANFAVDREAAHHGFEHHPGGFEGVRYAARANRGFLQRAVEYLVRQGVRQFLDVGAGIPSEGNVHEVAQDIAPESRIVYVDNDPIVLAHAHNLLESTPEGATAYVNGDFREPEAILETAALTLDLSQPVAVMLVGLLHVIPDEYAPHDIIRRLLKDLPSGSYLAISQLTTDVAPEDMTVVQERLDQAMGSWNPVSLRPVAEVEAFFDGLELVEGGVARGDAWGLPRSEAGDGGPGTPLYAGLARKP